MRAIRGTPGGVQKESEARSFPRNSSSCQLPGFTGAPPARNRPQIPLLEGVRGAPPRPRRLRDPAPRGPNAARATSPRSLGRTSRVGKGSGASSSCFLFPRPAFRDGGDLGRFKRARRVKAGVTGFPGRRDRRRPECWGLKEGPAAPGAGRLLGPEKLLNSFYSPTVIKINGDGLGEGGREGRAGSKGTKNPLQAIRKLNASRLFCGKTSRGLVDTPIGPVCFLPGTTPGWRQPLGYKERTLAPPGKRDGGLERARPRKGGRGSLLLCPGPRSCRCSHALGISCGPIPDCAGDKRRKQPLSPGDIFGLLPCLGGPACLPRLGGKWPKRRNVEDRAEGRGGWLGGRGRRAGGGPGSELAGAGEALARVSAEAEREVWADPRAGLGSQSFRNCSVGK